MNILELDTKLRSSAQSQELRICPPGGCGHQGDVYVHHITDGVKPNEWDVLVGEHTQVAVGEGIGSRHIATGDVKVYWPRTKTGLRLPFRFFERLTDGERATCIGPVVISETGWTLTHPEHAHWQFPAGLCYVTYQFDESTRRQVRD